ncbi:MAG: 50S ribosomal protein L9 [Fimbriimonadia bacterium]|jgi:large subunit ribosomal protein L9
MDVILNQTIAKVGHAGDVVRVSDGYARNFLIPRGLAQPATRGTRKAHEGLVKALDKKSSEIQLKAEELKSKLDGQVLTMEGRCAKNSTKLFGTITTTQIAEAIKERFHVEVDKRVIGLIHPLKSVGSHPVVLHLHRNVDANMTVEIIPVEA